MADRQHSRHRTTCLVIAHSLQSRGYDGTKRMVDAWYEEEYKNHTRLNKEFRRYKPYLSEEKCKKTIELLQYQKKNLEWVLKAAWTLQNLAEKEKKGGNGMKNE